MENKQNNEIMIIDEIGKKLNLKQKKSKDEGLFPIGVRHQKELRVLFNSKYNKITNAIHEKKKVSFKTFKAFYDDEIKLSRDEINLLIEKIEYLASIKLNKLKLELIEVFKKFDDLNNNFKKNLNYKSNNDYDFYLYKLFGASIQKIENEINKVKVSYNSDGINYYNIIEKQFNETYAKPYDNLMESLKKISDKFDEAVVLGDFADVREIYYFVDNVDTFLEGFEEPQILKIDGIFETEIKSFKDQLKDFDLENIKYEKTTNKPTYVDAEFNSDED